MIFGLDRKFRQGPVGCQFRVTGSARPILLKNSGLGFLLIFGGDLTFPQQTIVKFGAILKVDFHRFGLPLKKRVFQQNRPRAVIRRCDGSMTDIESSSRPTRLLTNSSSV